MTSNSTTSPPLTPLPPLLPLISDSVLLVVAPILAYWVVSLFFHLLDTYDLLSQYRLHTPLEVLKRNHVSRYEVIRDVLIQQVVQAVVGSALAVFEGIEMTGYERAEIDVLRQGWGLGEMLAEAVYWWGLPTARMGVAIFLLDTWQYWLHRLMHESKYLYRTFHSRHHRLYVPYAFGALYNHPFEGLLMDTLGASLAYKLSGLGIRGGLVFFVFSSCKTVDDHCGYSLPFDPLQRLFANNAGYHDVHHQSWGIKTNYSQPFLICWDRWCGTMWTGKEQEKEERYAKSRMLAEKAAAEDVRKEEKKEEEAMVERTGMEINGNGLVRRSNGVVNGTANGKANGKQ